MSYLHDWKIHHLTAVCSSPETKTGFSGNEACILTKGIKKHPPSYQCLSSGWQTEKENRKSKNTSCTWLDIVITSKTIHVATPTKEFSVGWGKVSAKPKLNPLHPWHHYVYSQYCSLHKSWGADRENLVKNQELLYSWWSSPLFSFKDQVLLEEKQNQCISERKMKDAIHKILQVSIQWIAQYVFCNILCWIAIYSIG